MATFHPPVSVAASRSVSLGWPRNPSHLWFLLLFVPCLLLLSLSESFLIFGLLTLIERADVFLNGSAKTFLRSSSFSQPLVFDVVGVTFEFLLPFCHPVTQRCTYSFRKSENTFHLYQQVNVLYTEFSTNVLWKFVWQVKMEAAFQPYCLYKLPAPAVCSYQMWHTQKLLQVEKGFAPGFSLCQTWGILVPQISRPWESDGWSPGGTARVKVI